MKVGALHLFIQLTARVACVRGRERRTGRASERRQDEGEMSGARRRSSGRGRHLHGVLSARQHDSELAHDVLSELANLHKTRLLTASRSVFVCVLLSWNVELPP